MSTYDVVWVSHAEEQFNSLPSRVRNAVMAKVTLLQQNPIRCGTYDKKADNYTTDFPFGVIVYARPIGRRTGAMAGRAGRSPEHRHRRRDSALRFDNSPAALAGFAQWDFTTVTR